MGAVLLQRRNNAEWKPVAYTSRALSSTEQRYAQIEKEALASTWTCERFAEFLIGKSFSIETDHKPLVPLLGSRNLDELPPRIQRLRMCLMRFSYTISHVPGKEIATADVLSRAPVDSTTEGLREEEINLYADSVIASLPATEKRLREIQTHQDNDDILRKLKQYCVEGWPDKFSIGRVFQPYLPFSDELRVQNGLLLFGCRILKPACADMENLKRKEQRYRQKQQQNYNRRHRAHDMPHLQPSDHVWVKDMLQRGTVVSTADTPRSYLIETPRGTLRRNRFHLLPTSVAPETSLDNTAPDANCTCLSPLWTLDPCGTV
ncbi:hypothetical protein AAFF_G00292000 [Aldrovandia affinis]|uniref:Reverse transcriptase RNase H-like domain-containing protein n=1 Tax=Aldrovandia affinis TaxID=143900 RepID=A0AAD7SQG7_9TELE|nr:hypothetical protein AAFF_G00292000 [Aldrovandia affinis]